jgi:hypothetical protein
MSGLLCVQRTAKVNPHQARRHVVGRPKASIAESNLHHPPLPSKKAPTDNPACDTAARIFLGATYA